MAFASDIDSLVELANFIVTAIDSQDDQRNPNHDRSVLDDYVQACYSLYGPYSCSYCDPMDPCDAFWGETGAALWISDGQIVMNFMDLCHRLGYVGNNEVVRLNQMDEEGLL